jgi:predicted phage terminase large subunit-like protein
MFKVDAFNVITEMPSQSHVLKTVRYWDKAGTQDAGAYTVGVKMSLLSSGKWVIEDVKRGRWNADERERVIRGVAEADGLKTEVWLEQEPGSSGRESGDASIRNLAGFSAHLDRPTGEKAYRADPFSVQVNSGNVLLLAGAWHMKFIEELRFFPFSTYKDQTDSSSGAFNHLIQKKEARMLSQ